MAVLPTRLLEIEFDTGVWTDVTADLVALGTRRGRNRESGAFETGTMRFTLRNDTRKYDPDHTAGTYYGKLRPNRRVRLRATYNAVTYPVFVGSIDRISQIYGGPHDAVAVFDTSDLFKTLARTELPRSVYTVEVDADTPALWFDLDEPSGSATVADAVAGVTLTGFGAPLLGAESLVTRHPGSAYSATDVTSGFAARGEFVAGGAGPQMTLEAVVDTVATTDSTIVSLSNPGEGFRVRLYMTAAGNAAFQVGKTVAGNTQAAALDSGVTINDGSPHHLAGAYDGAGGVDMYLYVDGVEYSTTWGLTSPWGSDQELMVGNIAGGFILPAERAAGLIGSIDEVAVYSGVLAAARAAAHSTARATPWNGDLPGPRLERILDLADVAAGDRDVDTATTPLQSTSLETAALDYAQKIEETDQGWLFITRDGKVRYIGRNAGVTGAWLTSLATLADDDSGAGIPYRTHGADVDEVNLITRATVSRDGSVAVTVYDPAAQSEFGWLDETHDGLLHDSDTYSRHYAEWLVNTHKAPGTRVGTVTLELTKDPATMYPAVLAVELADRVTYKTTPQAVGSTVTTDMRIAAISHETGPHYWTTSLQLTPFDLAGGVPIFVWDTTRWDEHVWGL